MSLLKWTPVYLSLVLLIGCCTIGITVGKLLPEYKGVDPEVAPLVDEWLSLAKERGITFDKKVTIGFKDIKSSDRTIGLSNYGMGFREIDIDTKFWARANGRGKTVLVFHELTHSYCDRRHDYGKDQLYNDGEVEVEKIGSGFYEDYCPTSIMYPLLVSERCFMKHYAEYVVEMFDRCSKW